VCPLDARSSAFAAALSAPRLARPFLFAAWSRRFEHRSYNEMETFGDTFVTLEAILNRMN